MFDDVTQGPNGGGTWHNILGACRQTSVLLLHKSSADFAPTLQLHRSRVGTLKMVLNGQVMPGNAIRLSSGETLTARALERGAIRQRQVRKKKTPRVHS